MHGWFQKSVLSFGLGVLAFTPWESLLVKFKLVEYQSPSFFGLPWWTPLAFGLATCGGIILMTVLDRLFNIPIQYISYYLVFEYMMVCGFFISIILLRQYPYILVIFLVFVVFMRLIFFYQPLDWVYFILGACLGPTGELVLTTLKLYLFTEPDFLGMPFWLPVLWGSIALSLRRVSWVLFPYKNPPPKSTIGLAQPS